MTKEWAEKILAIPKFGDPDCIAAVERMAQEPETQRLRNLLVGKKMVCMVCEGSSDGCKLCNAEGEIIIPRELVDGWELDILQDVCDEIGVKR